MSGASLEGRTVGITADRRSDDQAVLFSRLGAEVVAGPVLSTVRLPDPGLLRSRTEELIAAPPDFLIANTGIGMRTWLEAAGEWGLGPALRESLAGVAVAVRGPKAAGALTSAGLQAWWRSPSEQLGDLVAHLETTGLDGRTVAFQLHGDDGAELVARLEKAGARVVALPVYQWGPPADPGPAHHLIDRCLAGSVHAVTFTAGPQVHALVQLAGGRSEELLAALNSMVVGCIGPVCAAEAAAAGIARPVVPGHWRLGSLVKAVAGALTGAA